MIQFNVFFCANLANGFDRVLIGLTSFLRTTFIKFIGLFSQYVTKRSAVPYPSRMYRISFSRESSSSRGSSFSRSSFSKEWSLSKGSSVLEGSSVTPLTKG